MQQWVDCEFTGRDFRDEDLSRLHTERAMFSECDFSGVNLAESQHRGSAFRNCTFERTTLWHSTFAQCSMLGSVFVACRLRPLTLDDVDFTLAVLGGNDLRGLNLTGCRLRETSLVDTDLRRTDVRHIRRGRRQCLRDCYDKRHHNPPPGCQHATCEITTPGC